MRIKRKVLDIIKSLDYRTSYIRAYIPTKLRLLTLRDVTFIGVTGSAGKTTTKDITAHILSEFNPCYKNQLTHNNSIGVAWTVRNTTNKHHYCVIEAGGAEPNMMSDSLKFFNPRIAVITNIKNDHRSAFGSIEGIAQEKRKLAEAVPVHGTAILNIDDPLIKEMIPRVKCNIFSIGRDESATLRLIETRSQWPEPLTLEIEFKGHNYQVRTQLHGKQLAFSVLSSLAVAISLKLPIDKSITALENVKPTEARMEAISTRDNITFIRDDWKAPEWSLKYAFDFIKEAKAPRKIIIVGTVSDSTKSPSQRYPKVARLAIEAAELTIFVGPHAYKALKAQNPSQDKTIIAFENIHLASIYLEREMKPGDLILLKGNSPTDHLGRLCLNAIKPIKCWRTENECRSTLVCSKCPKLYEPYLIKEKNQVTHSSNSNTIIIIGLGNADPKLESTAHNIGFMVLNTMNKTLSGSWETSTFGQQSTLVKDGQTYILLKPTGFINDSGNTISKFLASNELNFKKIIVVHDDTDLKIGKIRHKTSGSDGGHNGIRSIIETFQTTEFHRLKMGVRNPEKNVKAKDMVLAQFDESELKQLDTARATASQLLEKFVTAKGKPKDNLLGY